MAQKRIFTIDIARAISIMLVVVGHYRPDNSPEWWMTFYSVLHTFRMPLFLGVSGYTYMYLLRERKDKQRNYQEFVKNKFQRLMIPYFFISVFVITVKLLVGGEGAAENPVSLASYYQMFYYPAAGPFVWFVFVLFMIFLIIPFFNTRKGLIALYLIALLLHFAPFELPEIFSYVSDFKAMLIYFVTGCLFYELRNFRTFIMNTNFLFYIPFFVLFFLIAKKEMSSAYFMAFMASMFGVVLVIKLAKFISEKGNTQQFFLWIAGCSYTIYLFHTTSQGFAKSLYAKLPLQPYIGDTATFFLGAVVAILTGIFIPVLLHHIITRKSKIFSYLIVAKYKKS